MSEPERRKLWVRAGGRCTLCRAYLLEGGLTHQEVPIGEGAHIVGQKESAGSPRGLDDLPADQRDLASNILLACSNCHTEIDKMVVAKLMTTQKLRELKRDHEDNIKHLTGLAPKRRTTVLRVQGEVRGAVPQLTNSAAAAAVIASTDRFPLFLPSFDQQGVEVDLRQLDEENDGSAGYYQAATVRIDRVLRDRVLEGVKQNEIEHLSVFAIARLPLLVYLGVKLDDGISADIYQRHRSTDGWPWPTAGAATGLPPPLREDRWWARRRWC